jgi:hypothetical protein
MGPELTEENVNLVQTAPGRYEGRYIPRKDGVYEFTAVDEDAGFGAAAYWTRAYAPELAAPGIDTAALAEAARIGGGRLLSGVVPEDWWEVRTPRMKTLADLTLPFAFLALMILLADIALREIPGGARKAKAARSGVTPDMESLIIRGLEAERHKPKNRRPTPAEAARILAERRSGSQVRRPRPEES